MKITVKYNIDFGKALKEVEGNKLFKTLNDGLSHKVAETSSRYILEGKVKPAFQKQIQEELKENLYLIQEI